MNFRTPPSVLQWILTALAALAVAWPATAAGKCEHELEKAKNDFEAGRIDQVAAADLETACLEGAAARDERARAYALLAQIFIARDRPEEAAEAVAALVKLDPDYRPDDDTPFGQFLRLVEEERGRVTFTYGVSKADEPLREAPATVAVVTADDIERRGYLDLEQILHDLPGFDISRGNGDVYSNIYLRGYRSDRSDRMLLVIDGVEQNDLLSNTAYLSRQYPLSNVRQVEVVYGPASTIYGANAFTGVINVTTKAPEAMLVEGENLGATATIAGGDFDTRYLDATLAGRTLQGKISWSLTGRTYRSDENDLSSLADWDFDPGALDDVDYRQVLRVEGALARQLADSSGFLNLCSLTGFCTVGESEGATTIELTEAGARRARERDGELFESLAGRDVAFRDDTDDWAIDGKLRFAGLTVGVQSWRRQEGTTPWYPDLLRSGVDNVWIPRQTAIYARYEQGIGGNLRLSFFSRFKRHELDDGSTVTRFGTYAGGGLNIVELAFNERPGANGRPYLQQIAFDQRSSQLRNELTLFYEPSAKLQLMGGVELRNSSVQIELTSSILEETPFDELFDSERFFAPQLNDSKVETTDLGFFVQATYRPRDDLKIVAGGRYDSNDVAGEQSFLTFDRLPFTTEPSNFQCLQLGRSGQPNCDLETVPVAFEDSGTVFNPRLAVIHTCGDYVFKAIYSEAFKEPTVFQKYTREPGVRQLPNPDLRSEKVSNLELAASWQRGQKLTLDAAVYQADYSDAVALKSRELVSIAQLANSDSRFLNIGGLRIRGAQLNASLRYRNTETYANYTYTDPANTDPTDEFGNLLPGVGEVRIGDIASHRLNFGVNAAFLDDKLNVNLRTNWVGARETGAGTTVPSNPLAEIDAYFVAHATLTYRWPRVGNWQLIVNNLFDEDYDHPGVQQAGLAFAARLPQPGRAVFLRFTYKR